MAFITPEQARAVRLKGSRVIRVDELDRDLRLLKLSGAAAMKAEALQAEVTEGKKTKLDLFEFLFQHAYADEHGVPLTHDDAQTLTGLLSLEALTRLLDELNASIGGSPK